jgi:hypothetical protein
MAARNIELAGRSDIPQRPLRRLTSAEFADVLDGSGYGNQWA